MNVNCTQDTVSPEFIFLQNEKPGCFVMHGRYVLYLHIFHAVGVHSDTGLATLGGVSPYVTFLIDTHQSHIAAFGKQKQVMNF